MPDSIGFDLNVAGNNMGNPGMYFFPYQGRWRMTRQHPWTEWRQTGDLAPRSLFWHFPHYIGAGHPDPATPISVIRRGNYKLLESLEDGHIELFDLGDDLGEQHNLAATLPEEASDLQQALAQWRTETKVQMPLPNPEYK